MGNLRKKLGLDIKKRAAPAPAAPTAPTQPPPQPPISGAPAAQKPVGRVPPHLGGEKAPGPQKPPNPGPKPVGFEKVTARCGHEIDVPLFEEKKDNFRARRLEKAKDRPCPGCREADELARQQAAQKRRGLRFERKGRLPGGSQFLLDPYDGVNEQWSGTLLVPHGGRWYALTGTKGGIVRLQAHLDNLYRALAKGDLSIPPADPAAVAREYAGRVSARLFISAPPEGEGAPSGGPNDE